MTKTQAIEYAVNHDDDDQLDPRDVRAAFVALYDSEPDEEEEGLMWSFIHAHSEVCDAVEAAESEKESAE